MTHQLILKNIRRTQQNAEDEELIFTEGVNVLVGAQNAGKTTWFRMIEYMLGDTDSPEKVLGEDIAIKYDTINLTLSINAQEYSLERRWKEKNCKGKIFIDGTSQIDAGEFTEFLFPKLNLPIVNYPSGNPTTERAWPQLGWRSIFRHMYRQARFWSEFVDKQPDVELYACLMLFLGFAEYVYPPELGNAVKAKTLIDSLRLQKENYLDTLTQVSKQIGRAEDIGVTPTYDTLNAAIASYEDLILELEENKDMKVLNATRDPSIAEIGIDTRKVQSDWLDLNKKKENALALLQNNSQRQREIEAYQHDLSQELQRLDRAIVAGQFMADIKVTHCPVCDQSVDSKLDLENECYMCHQSITDSHDERNSTKRLEFERSQIGEELKEIAQLIKTLQDEREAINVELSAVDNQLVELEHQLRPTRKAIAVFLQPEMSIIDQKVGQLNERIRYLNNLKSALHYREELNLKIQHLEANLAPLQQSLQGQEDKVSLDQPADDISDGFNTFLSALNSDGVERYPNTLGPTVEFTKSKMHVKIKGSPWANKLGDTKRAYFVLAYSYALLNLTRYKQYAYPGFLMIDFPVTFPDGDVVADKENYLVQPFCDFAKVSQGLPYQVIIAGRSFAGLKRANRIELDTQWV